MTDLEKLTAYFSAQGEVVLLHSQLESHPEARYSYLAANARAKIIAHDYSITEKVGDTERCYKQNPWQALSAFREEINDWVFGYIGYDLKNYVEDLDSANEDPVEAPDMVFMVPGFLLRYDHKSNTKEVLLGKLPAEDEVQQTIAEMSAEVELGDIRTQTTKSQYLRKIEEAQRSIVEGGFYEINLSHQLKTSIKGEPFALYQKMKQAGPVPFGSFINLNNISICCQSPERFLRKESNTVYSQPIKGTAKRGSTQEEDQALVNELLSSEKERAENLMIVDLVRNDLSRISEKGTVQVPELFSIQSFETVHQMVSTVTAKAVQKDPVAILNACFPMGSMTGAPKIRVMIDIEELEDYKRGIYSGAIGYITPDDDFDFNVVIRTAIVKNDTVFYSVGGAITGDSDPQKEWAETQIKARALLNVQSNISEA